MTQARWCLSGTVQAVPIAERWLVLLTGLALVAWTMVQATPLIGDRQNVDVPTLAALPLVAENAATSPATAPLEPEPSDRSADRTASARDVAPTGTVAAALGSTNPGCLHCMARPLGAMVWIPARCTRSNRRRHPVAAWPIARAPVRSGHSSLSPRPFASMGLTPTATAGPTFWIRRFTLLGSPLSPGTRC